MYIITLLQLCQWTHLTYNFLLNFIKHRLLKTTELNPFSKTNNDLTYNLSKCTKN